VVVTDFDGVEALVVPVFVLLLTDAVVDIEDVRGRFTGSDFAPGRGVRALLLLLAVACVDLDAFTLGMEGVLLMTGAALLLLDAVVEVDIVRTRDGPASGCLGTTGTIPVVRLPASEATFEALMAVDGVVPGDLGVRPGVTGVVDLFSA